MFYTINRSRAKFYLANAVTLGLYGAGYVTFKSGTIGKRIGANLPGVRMSLLLTILTLGLYPCVMLCVLAYKLGETSSSSLGHTVLALNIASLIAAIISGAYFLIVSIALWTHAVWLVAEASNYYAVGWQTQTGLINPFEI
jgi:hypothetical protein